MSTETVARLKRFPDKRAVASHAVGTTLRTAIPIVLGMAALHGLPEVTHDWPLLGGIFHGIDSFATNGFHGVDFGPVKINGNIGGLHDLSTTVSSGIDKTLHVNVATAVPDLIANNSFVHSHVGNLVRSDDLFLAEGLGALAGAGSAAINGLKLALPAERVPMPRSEARSEAIEVAKRLAARSARKYGKLDPTQIAIEIDAVSKDLSKGEIDKEALWADFLGKPVAGVLQWGPLAAVIRHVPFAREMLTPEGAAKATLEKEIYKRMGNNWLQSIWGLTDSWIAEVFKKIPAFGKVLDGVTKIGDRVVSWISPKKDVFGKRHTGASALMDFLIGDVLLGPVPALTALDVEETREILARPVLMSDKFKPQVDHAAAAIVGDAVKRYPRRYSVR